MKLLFEEPGSLDVAAVWDAADRRVSTPLLYVEARSAVAAAARTRRISNVQRETVRERLEALYDVIDHVQVDEELLRSAGHLTEEHALRAYDAVHLASAQFIADAEMLFVSFDRDLLAAASARGLATVSFGP